MTGLLPALSGCNVIYGLGMLEMGITFDLGQLVLDNEIAGLIKQAVNGIEVNDKTLSVDLIKEIGPFKDYLAHRSTYDHMRDISTPKLINRQMRHQWEKTVNKDVYEKAWDEAKHILDTYTPPQLSESVLKEVRAIITAAEDEMNVPQDKR
jgi:trimethylamine---corrinoid protein Co-methyltransferase